MVIKKIATLHCSRFINTNLKVCCIVEKLKKYVEGFMLNQTLVSITTS